jgi:hypothetical protein
VLHHNAFGICPSNRLGPTPKDAIRQLVFMANAPVPLRIVATISEERQSIQVDQGTLDGVVE